LAQQKVQGLTTLHQGISVPDGLYGSDWTTILPLRIAWSRPLL
jgi:hypothetical protein